MTRVIPTDVAQDLDAPSSPHALLGFLRVDHPTLVAPVLVVSDPINYVINGETYIGCPFEYVVLTDSDSPSIGQLRVQNVDRRIGSALRSMDERAKIGLEVRSTMGFNLSVDPRVENTHGSSVLYGFLHFSLIDVTVNAVEITGTVRLRDYSQEPWPGKRATQSRCPGLFR